MTHRGAFMHHHYKKGVFGMAKKGWGKFVAFAAVTGAVAAGVSYVLQYKTYHGELEKDFREFEDGGEDMPAPGYALQNHGRYSHARSYLSRTIEAAGLKLAESRDAVLRRESATDVHGLVMTITRPDT